MLRKYAFAFSFFSFSPIRLASEFATAFAISVFPHPGGPYNRTPFGGFSWCSMNSSVCRNGSSTASLIASICELSPPMST